ncbi:MAG: type IV pilus secretin PilQ [Gammaproteobacteria bacterium]|nr:type IV pilus secretin PilQ [Gammaproteobacteria bacterium]
MNISKPFIGERAGPLWGGVLAALALCSIGMAAMAQTLDDISFVELSGERVQVKLQLSEAGPEPLSFSVDNPARVALDFPGVGLNLERKSQTIGVGMARSITAVEASGRTRVVLNLIRLVPYEIETRGSTILVTLDNAGAAGGRAFPDTVGKRSDAPDSLALENVDFRRGPEGEGRVLVTLSDASVVIDTRQEGDKLIVDFLDTTLPRNLERKLDVVDFATPVHQVDTFPQNNDTRMVVRPGDEPYEYLAYQSDTLFTLELKPVTEEEAERRKKERVGFTGERLSLNFQNIEVRAVLQLLADFTGLNLVASDSVTGNVTLRLKNVPWDQAMDIILKSRGLGMRKTGNVIMVAPTEEIAAREKLELEAQQQIEELAPLNNEFVQINYAKASDLATLLKGAENSLLSERGNVSIDQRTNTLLVRDTAANLEAVRGLVARLDVPVRQVLVESRIVIATRNFAQNLGVRFGYSRSINRDDEDQTSFFLGGSTAGDPQEFITDLGVAHAGSIGLAIGKVNSWLLQLELQALQAEGRGEVLANPRVITSVTKILRPSNREPEYPSQRLFAGRNRHQVRQDADLCTHGDSANHAGRFDLNGLECNPQ